MPAFLISPGKGFLSPGLCLLPRVVFSSSSAPQLPFSPGAEKDEPNKYLREAQELQEPKDIAPCQRIEDFEELSAYSAGKRKEFEETIRRTRITVHDPFVLEQHGTRCKVHDSLECG
ncbi:hypothetical protein BT69DRAFT_1315003 [Atractiella rhizophila]|nr:hypothetical protein BT69DRAFT_1315003 [Atractiella rhizophila]